MSDVTPTPAPAPVAAPEAEGRARRRRGPVARWTLRILGVLVAVLAALIVTGFSIDLGPSLRKRAEAEATKYLERPMHIGKLSALLSPGEFELDDIVIEGLTANERPFLTAKRLHFYVPWWGLIRKQLTVEVRMTDWTMLVETFPGGKHNMPKLKPKPPDPTKPPPKPLPFTTRVNFVYADRGAFTYEDHATPWHVAAPNLNVDIAWADALKGYVGTARFSGGTVQIQNYLPMSAALTARFGIDASIVRLPSIDLVTDGAHSRVRGEVDFSKWPEQRYLVDSTVNFARMKDIFFAKETWKLSGEGRFQGVFHLYKDGRELRGDFTSAQAGVNSYTFPNLKGSLDWLPHRFEVANAEADLYGGRAKFDYSMDPIGTPGGSTSTFNVEYSGVDLVTLGREHDWKPLLVRGRATGRNDMQWQTGHFHDTVHGDGESTVAQPAGVDLMQPSLPEVPVIAHPDWPFKKEKSISPLAVGGHVRYRFDPEWLDFDDSWAASASTHVSFRGRSAYTERADIPFHVTSADWQESDRVLVAIMAEFGSAASPIEVGGRGTFDGVFTESFNAPRVTGTFAGDFVRAWGVTWGRAVGDLVIQNHYVDVTNGVIGDAGQRIFADGRYSLGYPRPDGGEEIHAHVRADHWPMHDFRTAFSLNDWPIDGTASADLTLTGPYERPLGSGTLTIDNGVAWRETFDQATSTMQFVGNGLNLTRISMTKGTGLIHGVMWIGWDKSYSFDADGDHIAVESLQRFQLPQAPLSGVLKFKTTGTGSFNSPTYTFEGFIADLSAGSEGVGPVLGKLTVRNNVMAIDYLEAASDRLGKVSGSGTVALNEAYDADLTLRFTDTSIDPYLKFIAAVEPQLSPFFRAVASGSVRVAGELVNPAELLVDASIDDAKLTLLDYDLHNDGKLRVTFDQNVISVQQFKLAGNGTNLELRGAVPLNHSPMSLVASGDVSLAILQGLSSLKYVSSSGTASVSARLEGTYPSPVFSGFADVTDGRVRHLSLPRSIENVNGRISFDALGINVDGVTGQMGGGDIAFGGNISLKGFVPSEFNLTATGRSMRLRYPEGFETTADADLRLTGPIATPTLSGTVDVLHTTFTRPLETDLSVLFAGGAAGVAVPVSSPVVAGAAAFPLNFEIKIQAPPIAIVDTKDAKIFGHINSLVYSGTLDRPVLSGRVEIDSGELFFGGNRYVLNSGYIDFFNPAKIEPFFNIELETRLRASGQTYNVTLRATGTYEHFTPTITSDPPLPQNDILSLMLGENPDVGTAEQRALRSPQETQTQVLRTVMVQVLTAPLSSRVGSVVEKTVGLDTVQIVPLLGNDASLQQLSPGARLTLGQRISSRVFLTYQRTLNQQQLEIITLEYEQSDRISWVLSRNEDHTFALDFRIRHVF